MPALNPLLTRVELPPIPQAHAWGARYRGGHGAPLAAVLDGLWLAGPGGPRVGLNLGGLSIRLQGTPVYAGTPVPFDGAALSLAMDAPELVVQIDLAAGAGTGTAWGCDLSADYVAINADYHT